MSRQPRKISKSNINHIILRGNNKQIIFEDCNDYLHFIDILIFYKEECHFKIYAYCIMNNHVHLLVEHTSTNLDVIMKKIEVKFVRWYNNKYQRIGNLFQDRFKSEPITDEAYFLTVFRYIHQNPIHAGLEDALGSYPWSSYRDYLHKDSSFVNIQKALSLFPSHSDCLTFLNSYSDTKCLEHYSSIRLPDEEALKIIQSKTPCSSPSDFQHMVLSTRNQYLKLLHDEGITLRQLSRLTGISRTAITQAINH